MAIKQTARIISTYAADISGICSAMYELGGMTVMHDASGCNSTYNTHDEPRWYHMDSLVFISGLSEMEAMFGDEEKLIGDIVTAAEELNPRFITLGGTPIPMMMGTDFPSLAKEIERRTGLMTFGIATDGMHSYISGVSKAFALLAKHVCLDSVDKKEGLWVNILGATPLDFSVTGNVPSMKHKLEEQGIHVHSIWAMEDDISVDLYEKIQQSASVHVNLVISSSGLEAARVLWRRFGMPYVVGAPCGEMFTEKIIQGIREAARTGEHQNVCQSFDTEQTVIIGESITSLSLANAIYEKDGRGARVLCGVDMDRELKSEGCINARDEVEMEPYLKEAEVVIGDPMYKPICPEHIRFIPLPHEGFSGRIYRDGIPNLVDGFDEWYEEHFSV